MTDVYVYIYCHLTDYVYSNCIFYVLVCLKKKVFIFKKLNGLPSMILKMIIVCM